MAAKHPQVLWAQRESFVYVTIEVDEAKVETLKTEGNKLLFVGSSKTDKYEAQLELFDDIEENGLKRIGASTRVIELVLTKATAAWWPRLLKDKAKVHWLKVDFSKWKDEDDEEVEDAPEAAGLGNGFDINQYMSSMNMGAGGADFGGLDDDEEDEMPELEDNEEEEPKEAKA